MYVQLCSRSHYVNEDTYISTLNNLKLKGSLEMSGQSEKSRHYKSLWSLGPPAVTSLQYGIYSTVCNENLELKRGKK